GVPDAAFGLIRATHLAPLSPRERGLFRSTSIHDQTSGARRVARISEAHPGSPRCPDDLEGPGCGLRPYPGYASGARACADSDSLSTPCFVSHGPLKLERKRVVEGRRTELRRRSRGSINQQASTFTGAAPTPVGQDSSAN